jgi:hypothetical protein
MPPGDNYATNVMAQYKREKPDQLTFYTFCKREEPNLGKGLDIEKHPSFPHCCCLTTESNDALQRPRK